jgi:hypothetical protein
MKKKMKTATMAAGVVAMSVGLFNSFATEANEGSGYMCCPGTTWCTDESGTTWTKDRPVARNFPGDTCSNH